MKLIIGSRKSDLARLQAYAVGGVLSALDEVETVDYYFKTSLGDQNQEDPLWQMPEKGVFTQDLTKDLLDDRVHLVVHSWKDLPVEEREETFVAGTLPRADQRDLLLFKKNSVGRPSVKLLSSSPRRAYNLTPFLAWALPGGNTKILFKDVRGNVQTRIKKLLEDDQADGLVVAKAALDRMLSTRNEEFKESWEFIKTALQDLRFMILPLRENPTAAAQGALAIEVKRDDQELIELLKKINCNETFEMVKKEREILRSYGGGCHQKIGVSFLKREYGEIKSLRGLTDSGQTLNEWGLLNKPKSLKFSAEEAFPQQMGEARLVEDEDIEYDKGVLEKSRAFFVAKARAIPEGWRPSEEQLVWAAGFRTFKKLAEMGVWVNGTSEAMGEAENPRLENLVGPLQWLRLTHEAAQELSSGPALATYRLTHSRVPENLISKKAFFWSSFSSFQRAIELYPEIQKAHHACGPGKTAKLIEAVLKRRPDIYLSYKEWRSEFS